MMTLVEDLGLLSRDNEKQNKRYGLYKCDCGFEKIVASTYVKSGKVKSCGCSRLKILEEIRKTHNLSKSPLYSVWSTIKTRCNNPNSKWYESYGKRGIKMSHEWENDFEKFHNWAIENGWEKGLQIDRIDNDGGYTPNNCRIVTNAENTAVGRRRKQSNNTSGFVGVKKSKWSWLSYIQIDGVKINLGSFKHIEDAVQSRINKEVELFGEQKTNFHFIDCRVKVTNKRGTK